MIVTLKGKSNIDRVDLMMYQGIVDLAENKMQKIDEELIPSFIVKETLDHFSSLEKYELCKKIKAFFEINKEFIIESTRAEWFGISTGEKRQEA